MAGAGLSFVTVDFPTLPTSALGRVGVKEFLVEYDHYVLKIKGIPGAVHRPLQDAIDKDIIDFWIKRKEIIDRSDEEVRKKLDTIAGDNLK
jgi:hypothetical protein